MMIFFYYQFISLYNHTLNEGRGRGVWTQVDPLQLKNDPQSRPKASKNSKVAVSPNKKIYTYTQNISLPSLEMSKFKVWPYYLYFNLILSSGINKKNQKEFRKWSWRVKTENDLNELLTYTTLTFKMVFKYHSHPNTESKTQHLRT